MDSSEDEILVGFEVKPIQSNKRTYSQYKRLKLEPEITIVSDLPKIDDQTLGRLNPGRMLNDSIVDFYLRYCLYHLAPCIKSKFHLFDTFFYYKLKSLNKPEQVERMSKRWDKHVKLLDKDYLVIPICDSKHWFLAIVCFASKIRYQQGSGASGLESPINNAACICIFDSLRYKYLSRFDDCIRSFLTFRWQHERPKENIRDFCDRNLFKARSVKVPRQRNPYDCGVYLLHFFESFIKDPLKSFTLILDDVDFVPLWSMNPVNKRESIKRIITLHNKVDSSISEDELVQIL